MKFLLLLLLPLCGMAFFSFEDVNKKLNGKGGELRKKFGQISKENLAKIRQSLGQDPEKRKARLQKMFTKKMNQTLTEEQKQTLQERLSKIRPVKTEKPKEDEPVDLLEVNMKEGVSEYLFQGDLLLTDAQMTEIEQNEEIYNTSRVKRQATTVYDRWTGNTVYYYFDSSLDQRKKNSVAVAIKYFESRTCLKFVYSTTAANRIRVFKGAGCYSAVGMNGGEQELSLADGCESIGAVAHEFSHALGIWHTQMRYDRDDYVIVDLRTVPVGDQGNFMKRSSSEITTMNIPYEYGSVMHYRADALAEYGSLSIVPKDYRYAYTMGNGQISFYDIKLINDFYQCSEKCPQATSAQCQNGGIPNPNNCAICNCPLGYGGAVCNERPAGCGEALTASTAWQSKTITVGDPYDTTYSTRDDFTMCNYWIHAPAGKQVQVKITSMYNSQCQYGCPYSGIEIKTDPNTQITNPRYCCPEFNNQEMTSWLNPTPIVAVNRVYYANFTIQYRYVALTGPPPTTKGPAPAPSTTSTTKAPTPAPTTTRVSSQAPTTTNNVPIISRNCTDMLTGGKCDALVAAGLCKIKLAHNTFQHIKFICGKSCGLCGKANLGCYDILGTCEYIKSQGLCTKVHPMSMEFGCAETCGFCDNPN